MNWLHLSTLLRSYWRQKTFWFEDLWVDLWTERGDKSVCHLLEGGTRGHVDWLWVIQSDDLGLSVSVFAFSLMHYMIMCTHLLLERTTLKFMIHKTVIVNYTILFNFEFHISLNLFKLHQVKVFLKFVNSQMLLQNGSNVFKLQFIFKDFKLAFQ